MLASVTELERAGVIVRMPATWSANRPARPKVAATVGMRAPSKLGLDGVLDFSVEVSLDGETLTPPEIDSLLAGTDGLALLRGQWVEIDRARLERTMERFQAAEALAATQGLTFAEAMRMLADPGAASGATDPATAEWSSVSAGPWLAETLKTLRNPDGAGVDPGPALRGTLRPYQTGRRAMAPSAVRAWARGVPGRRYGAGQDHPGAGAAAHSASPGRQRADALPPCLLVAPASLLANWAAELERFAPDLRARIVHPSAMTAEEARQFEPADARRPRPGDHQLRHAAAHAGARRDPMAAADPRRGAGDQEPGAKQTKAVKALQAQARIALTGTPVENSLGDLWSIFDVINPGLLGGAKQFAAYTKSLGRAKREPLWPAARAGAALHPPAHENRPIGDRRPAR